MSNQTSLDYARPNQQTTTQQLKPIARDVDARIANTLIKCQADTLTPITVKAIESSLKQLAMRTRA